jgi:hypothetical protein
MLWGVVDPTSLRPNDLEIKCAVRMVEGVPPAALLSAGYSHIAVVTESDEVCWPGFSHGIMLIIEIDCYISIFFIDSIGSLDLVQLYTWGSNRFGSLGHEHEDPVEKPQPVAM